MKIAVAADNNQVAQHFGHCEGFAVFTAEGGAVTGEEFIPNPGHRPGFLPHLLHELGSECHYCRRHGCQCRCSFWRKRY